MPRTPMWRRYLRFWGTDPPADVDAEIAFHIDELVRHFVARGMTVEHARAEAGRRFGSVDRVRDECLTVDTGAAQAARRRDAFDALWHDLGDACRGLKRNPGFTAGAALILALGIGLNTTVYSFNKALLFPTVPVGDPARLIRLWSQNMASGAFAPLSEADFADVSAANHSFVGVAAGTIQPMTLTGGTQGERIAVMRATTNLFPLMHVQAALGRVFGPEGAADDGSPVALVSHRTWRNRFAGDPAVVGRDIHLNGQSYTIVGVMPESFWFESRDIEVWLPLSAPRPDGPRDERTLMAFARLNPHVSSQMALADVQALGKRLAHDHTDTNAGWDLVLTGLVPLGLGEEIFFALVTTLLGLLLAAACAHVANLLLARGMERRGEIAIRAALGAGRRRILRQLLLESAGLSIVGGACSLLVSSPILALIRTGLGSRTPFLSDISLDGAALGITAGLIVVAMGLFGFAPALRLSSVTAGDAVKQPPGGPIAGRRRRPLASLLIGLEVMVATVAVIVSVLIVRTLNHVRSMPLGFTSDGVSTFRIETPEYKYVQADTAARVLREIRTRLLGLPSVVAAGAGMRLPLAFGPPFTSETIALDGGQAHPTAQRPWAITSIVTPGYFEALRIPVLQGRSFDDRDHATSTPVALVSQSMARAYWSDGSAVGRRVKLGGAQAAGPWLTVVGVVDDVRPVDPTSLQVRQLYRSFDQSPVRALTYFVKTDDPTNNLHDVRRVVRDVDPELQVLELRTMTDAVADVLSGPQLAMRVIWMNAAIALALAITGVYSVVAFISARRGREIAIRVALGGRRSAIVVMLLRQALRPALAGVGIGLVLAALVSRAIALLLYGVDPLDPLTYGLTALSLSLAAAAAGCVPAVRASRVNVAGALRSE